MTIKSQIDYRCPDCKLEWLPYAKDLLCPVCQRPVPESEVTAILAEGLESARFNKRLYGRFEVEYWITRRLGDRYLEWGFKALQLAHTNPGIPPEKVAIAALMDLDLEEMTPYREDIQGYLATLVHNFRLESARNPEAWQTMPEPEVPFFGRKIIED